MIGQRSASVPSSEFQSGARAHAEVVEAALEHLEGEVVLERQVSRAGTHRPGVSRHGAMSAEPTWSPPGANQAIDNGVGVWNM